MFTIKIMKEQLQNRDFNSRRKRQSRRKKEKETGIAGEKDHVYYKDNERAAAEQRYQLPEKETG